MDIKLQVALQVREWENLTEAEQEEVVACEDRVACLLGLTTEPRKTKSVEYLLVAAPHEATLSQKVTALLADGWKLYGSPTATVVVDTTGDWGVMCYEYAQAATRG